MPLVERYNEMYAGQYRIVVEEVPQDDYAEKIKNCCISRRNCQR